MHIIIDIGAVGDIMKKKKRPGSGLKKKSKKSIPSTTIEVESDIENGHDPFISTKPSKKKARKGKSSKNKSKKNVSTSPKEGSDNSRSDSPKSEPKPSKKPKSKGKKMAAKHPKPPALQQTQIQKVIDWTGPQLGDDGEVILPGGAGFANRQHPPSKPITGTGAETYDEDDDNDYDDDPPAVPLPKKSQITYFAMAGGVSFIILLICGLIGVFANFYCFFDKNTNHYR